MKNYQDLKEQLIINLEKTVLDEKIIYNFLNTFAKKSLLYYNKEYLFDLKRIKVLENFNKIQNIVKKFLNEIKSYEISEAGTIIVLYNNKTKVEYQLFDISSFLLNNLNLRKNSINYFIGLSFFYIESNFEIMQIYGIFQEERIVYK